MAVVICGCQLRLRHSNDGVYAVRMILVLLRPKLLALNSVAEEAREVTPLGGRVSARIFLENISCIFICYCSGIAILRSAFAFAIQACC